MALISKPARVCDRPGCDATVTDKGLPSAGISTAGVAEVRNFEPPEDNPDAPRPPDLCRECRTSLEDWWSGVLRRRTAKADAEQRERTADAADAASL